MWNFLSHAEHLSSGGDGGPGFSSMSPAWINSIFQAKDVRVEQGLWVM